MPAALLAVFAVIKPVWNALKPYWSQILAYVGGYRAAKRSDETASQKKMAAASDAIAKVDAAEPQNFADFKSDVLDKGEF